MMRVVLSFLCVVFAHFSFAQTVVDVIVGSDDHTTLEAAVVAAGLDSTLSDSTATFTVFAPTDSAFALLPAGLVDTLLADPTGDLTNILLYHVLGDTVRSTTLTNGMMAATLSGDSILVRIDTAGSVFINDAMVISADVPASNGLVHIIDAVLIPPADEPVDTTMEAKDSTVVDVIANSAVHTTLEAALIAAGLDSVLSDTSASYTVFAPTDSAFAALPAGLVDSLLLDPGGELTQILLYHVLNAAVGSGSLSDGQMATTLQGSDITVTIDSTGAVFINEVRVVLADIMTDNGVVHVIDAVLVPPADTTIMLDSTVVDVIVNSDVHTTLEAAVTAAGLVEALSGEGPFTVFAPTDSAFAALPAGLLDTLLLDPSGDLTQILLYHVLDAAVVSDSLSDGQVATTLQGSDITVTIDSTGAVFINDAMVVIADIITDNGVVHVIDVVLVPSLEVSTRPELASTAGIRLFPNPSSGTLNLAIPTELAEGATARIYDFQGRALRSWELNQAQSTISTDKIAPGAYIILVETHGKAFYQRFTVK